MKVDSRVNSPQPYLRRGRESAAMGLAEIDRMGRLTPLPNDIREIGLRTCVLAKARLKSYRCNKKEKSDQLRHKKMDNVIGNMEVAVDKCYCDTLSGLM